MLRIVLAGLLIAYDMRIESFPRIEPRRLVISVAYPGATAAQVDEGY
jgi:multidrug efflux pump subunit AcrB